jgi:hypothetical protein
MHRFILTSFIFALGLACTTEPESDDEGGTTTSPSTTDAEESTSEESTSEESTSTSEESTSDDTTSSDGVDSLSFLDTFDNGPWADCDPFAQDCPEGEKCVPQASSGDVWDTNTCVSIMGDQAPGEPCTYDGPFAATDDCDASSWCWEVDENGNGICHPFCQGTADEPECPPASACFITNSGVINICITTCDPVLQDCSDGEGCYWTGVDFNCIFTTGGGAPDGEPCGYINDCTPGSMCIDAEALPTCGGSSCCTNFCDLELGDGQCAAVPGTVCASFFEQGEAPPEYAHVGVCILPP